MAWGKVQRVLSSWFILYLHACESTSTYKLYANNMNYKNIIWIIWMHETVCKA
jgi:hypothetical protein